MSITLTQAQVDGLGYDLAAAVAAYRAALAAHASSVGEPAPVADPFVVAVVQAGGFEIAPPPAPPPVDLAAYAKAARDRHEDGGITVSGVPIATDDRSKTLVLGARRRVEKDPSLVTKWSAADGSIYPLDASTIIAVSDAIGDFVAELFEAYAGILADLAAGTITSPGEIDARYGALDVAF